MSLISRACVPSSGRSVRLHMWYLTTKSKYRRLIIGFQKKKGRSLATGRKLILSKGTNAYRNIHYLSTGGFGLLVTSLIVEYRRKAPQNSIVALLCNAFGCWFYFLATSTMEIFNYYRIITKISNNPIHTFFLNWQWPALLTNFPPHSNVCLLGNMADTISCEKKLMTSYKVRFVKAVGSTALVLSTQFYECWALLVFPSKKFKILNPAITIANFGTVGVENISGLLKQPKAGAHRILHGFSPQVRGTVKNANDHPNGGRSRALRCSRTPWGQIAKKSRKQIIVIS